jgi:transposase
VYSVHDWAEVHRLHQRDGWSKTAIARKLSMSRNTVDRLLRLDDPPRYKRRSKGSLLDPFKADIAEMLESDAQVPATVILDHLQARGYEGRITILKDYLHEERPRYQARRSFQRTGHIPGEIGQFDWWDVPVRSRSARTVSESPTGSWRRCRIQRRTRRSSRSPRPWPTSVPRSWERSNVSAASPRPACSTTTRRSSRLDQARTRCSMTRSRRCSGHVRLKPIILEKERPESKGQAERTIGYLERSFLPLRSFESIEDLQDQHDTWARNNAHRRHHRRVGARVTDAYNKTHA